MRRGWRVRLCLAPSFVWLSCRRGSQQPGEKLLPRVAKGRMDFSILKNLTLRSERSRQCWIGPITARFALTTGPKSARKTVHHKLARKAVQFTSHGKHARRDTMPVGTGIKREKVPFQQVLLQLSPFFWQGDASWAWNTKVPFWTGENQSRITKV